MADQFIVLDDVQYTRRDWRNRNKIKTPAGAAWLTIPVDVKGKYHQKINETQVASPDWAADHWKTICQNYAQAAYFKDYKDRFEQLYGSIQTTDLSHINLLFIKLICRILDISTPIDTSGAYTLVEGKTERLVDLCKQAGADIYYSGPAAKNYIDEALFQQAGIELRYFDYSGYPVYTQLYGEFDHQVSILDLIFNEGPEAGSYMKSFGQKRIV